MTGMTAPVILFRYEPTFAPAMMTVFSSTELISCSSGAPLPCTTFFVRLISSWLFRKMWVGLIRYLL